MPGATTSYVLLGLLEDSARHGYDLKLAYDRRFGGAKPLRFGRVYRILAQLVRDRTCAGPPTARPRTRTHDAIARRVTAEDARLA
ncbi:PadR family transcriptional regulator [Actinoplanes subtropicus]|uniref:PadR family transcriptional regulator n=1 Tax=Actinoplanes subtropicus TaxID=543632 RepID=UPI0004C3EF99|nr:helix-turn-helix transcriptional regulator [Actinoplanes subtropicus]